MNKKIITALLALVWVAGWAQTKVIGHVVNERGDGVEYVSIGIEEDDGEDQSSIVGVISDAQGRHQLLHRTHPLGERRGLAHLPRGDADGCGGVI